MHLFRQLRRCPGHWDGVFLSVYTRTPHPPCIFSRSSCFHITRLSFPRKSKKRPSLCFLLSSPIKRLVWVFCSTFRHGVLTRKELVFVAYLDWSTFFSRCCCCCCFLSSTDPPFRSCFSSLPLALSGLYIMDIPQQHINAFLRCEIACTSKD